MNTSEICTKSNRTNYVYNKVVIPRETFENKKGFYLL